jgi:hypothetical protein
LADLSKDFVIETISLVGRTDTVIFSNNWAIFEFYFWNDSRRIVYAKIDWVCLLRELVVIFYGWSSVLLMFSSRIQEIIFLCLNYSFVLIKGDSSYGFRATIQFNIIVVLSVINLCLIIV